MTVHQCPKCELRFQFKTELDDHCWHDHPEFRHEYPAAHVVVAEDAAATAAADAVAAPVEHHHVDSRDLGRWLTPRRPH